MTVQIEIREETAAKLQAVAAALELSLEEYLERIAALFPALPINGAAKVQRGPTPYELAKDLIGSIDSSIPDDDPDSQPEYTEFGAHLLQEYRKQVEKLS